jgi:anti-anti-sigma regulatory factor
MVSVDQETTEQGVRISIRGRMTIEEASDLRTQLIEALDHDHVLLSVDGVDEADLSGLQLLCSAHKHAVKNGRTLNLSGQSQEVFRQALEAIGLRRETGCVKAGEATCLWVEK